jgi:hypothetical protein
MRVGARRMQAKQSAVNIPFNFMVTKLGKAPNKLPGPTRPADLSWVNSNPGPAT